MIFFTSERIQLAQFELLGNFNSDINHFITTREKLTLSSNSDDFNLSISQTKNIESVITNRKILASAVGLSPNDFVFPIQVHGTNIVKITDENRGKGCFSLTDAFANTDGFITNIQRLCLITMAADCVPIIFFDSIKKAIGVAHAGWKGTVLRIPRYLIEAMQHEYGTKPRDLIVGIGPSGGPCCYEVGQDVEAEVKNSFSNCENIIKNVEDKTIFDMWEANRTTLIEAGVKPGNIQISGICTISSNNKFFSARQGDGGRFVAGIFLK
jgi:hypothetical protein